MAEEEVTYPQALPISKKVNARVGFKDDRVEIIVQTGIPLIGRVTLKLEPEDMEAIMKVKQAQDKWLRKPNFVRKHTGAP